MILTPQQVNVVNGAVTDDGPVIMELDANQTTPALTYTPILSQPKENEPSELLTNEIVVDKGKGLLNWSVTLQGMTWHQYDYCWNVHWICVLLMWICTYFTCSYKYPFTKPQFWAFSLRLLPTLFFRSGCPSNPAFCKGSLRAGVWVHSLSCHSQAGHPAATRGSCENRGVWGSKQ